MLKIKVVDHHRLSMTTEETTYQVVSDSKLDPQQFQHLRNARVLGGGQGWRVLSQPTTKKVGWRTFYVYRVVDHSDSGD